MSIAVPFPHIWIPRPLSPWMKVLEYFKMMRDPATGKINRDPDSGKIVRSIVDSNCCCDAPCSLCPSGPGAYLVTFHDVEMCTGVCYSTSISRKHFGDINGTWLVPFDAESTVCQYQYYSEIPNEFWTEQYSGTVCAGSPTGTFFHRINVHQTATTRRVLATQIAFEHFDTGVFSADCLDSTTDTPNTGTAACSISRAFRNGSVDVEPV